MNTNVWSFSLYWPVLHYIFTHIFVFSIPAFSLDKKLLWFVQNVLDNFDKVCTFLSCDFSPVGRILWPPSACVVSHKNNNLVVINSIDG